MKKNWGGGVRKSKKDRRADLFALAPAHCDLIYRRSASFSQVPSRCKVNRKCLATHQPEKTSTILQDGALKRETDAAGEGEKPTTRVCLRGFPRGESAPAAAAWRSRSIHIYIYTCTIPHKSCDVFRFSVRILGSSYVRGFNFFQEGMRGAVKSISNSRNSVKLYWMNFFQLD